MNAETANNQISFQLPRFSYVDARMDEFNPREVSAAAAPRRGIVARLADFLAGMTLRSQQRTAIGELSTMTDLELKDIGLHRGDLDRVFQPAFNNDLLARAHAFS